MASRLPMLCLLSAAVLLLAGLPQCSAIDHPVTWSTTVSPKTLNVKCADSITLTWAGTHDVAKATSGTCPNTNLKMLSGPAKAGGKYTYTIGKKTTGAFWLICTVQGHCAAGQNLMVNVTCPTTKATSSPSPNASPAKSPSTASPAMNMTMSSPTPSPKASPKKSAALPSAQLALGWAVVAAVSMVLSL